MAVIQPYQSHQATAMPMVMETLNMHHHQATTPYVVKT